MTKNKKDIIREVAKKVGVTQEEVRVILEALLDTISDTLSSDDRIELRGFGVFCTKKRKARMARIPKTGKFISLPERRVPVFKPSKLFKINLLS
jgi:DNA-binding protein HU-beta